MVTRADEPLDAAQQARLFYLYCRDVPSFRASLQNAGVLVGEIIGGKELVAAGKSSWGSLLGTTAGMIGKLVLAFIMVAWFVVDVMV